MTNTISKIGVAATLFAAPLHAQGIPGIMAPDAAVEKIATGFQFTEGPVWDKRGFLLFSDIPADTIYKWTPVAGQIEGKSEVFRKPSGQSNGLAINAAGQLFACEHKNRRVSVTVYGIIVPIAERLNENLQTPPVSVPVSATFEGKRFNSPNDLTIAGDGAVYFTDPAYGLPRMTEGKELDFEGVFRIAPDGKITLLARDFVHPNGIALSPDGKTLYVNDSDNKVSHMRAFDVLPDGSIANGRIFAELKEAGKRGSPDGLKVDNLGNVYSSGPGGVWIFSPAGALLGKISVPEGTTNLAWGDADGKSLFITASKSVYRVKMLAAGR